MKSPTLASLGQPARAAAYVKPARGSLADGEVAKPAELDDLPEKPARRDHWGWHLMLDCSGTNARTDDKAIVRAFIKELVKEIKMTPIGEPMIVKVTGQDGRGVSALQLITTSNIAFHSDESGKCLFLDTFSCGPFSPKLVVGMVKKHFAPKHIAWRFFTRDAGPDWPKK